MVWGIIVVWGRMWCREVLWCGEEYGMGTQMCGHRMDPFLWLLSFNLLHHLLMSPSPCPSPLLCPLSFTTLPLLLDLPLPGPCTIQYVSQPCHPPAATNHSLPSQPGRDFGSGKCIPLPLSPPCIASAGHSVAPAGWSSTPQPAGLVVVGLVVL